MSGRAWINALALSIPLWAAIIFALAGCGDRATDAPALPGVVDNVRFTTPDEQRQLCHRNSRWSQACMLSATGQIVMPLPQYFPNEEYARLWLWELAHRQQHWPDPPAIAAQLRADDAKGTP
jgi:hypothetical protein